jgi:16S rRNA G1207 methylase RsmC
MSDWVHSVDIHNFPVPQQSSDEHICRKRVRELSGARSETADEIPKITAVSFKWNVAPGLFAGGVVDVMTLAMIKCLERPHAGSRNLDFACGSGIITKWLLLAQPNCHVCMCDNDTVALEVAKMNNPTADVVLSNSWDAATESSSLAESCREFDNIYSNPPLHRGDLGF